MIEFLYAFLWDQETFVGTMLFAGFCAVFGYLFYTMDI